MSRSRVPLLLVFPAVTSACALFGSGPRGPAPPSPAEQYATFADTIVCVVDPETVRGLSEIDAKKTPSGQVVVLSDDRVRPFDQLHPASPRDGYAADVSWFKAGDPVTVDDRRYVKTGGERLISLGQLERLYTHRGLPLFAAPGDSPPPRALYVAVRPGCVFQAYVRSDLL